MTRVEITLGLLAIIGTIFITALIGLGEPKRMARDELAFQSRRVESGAQMFDQYCSSCHGVNAAGGVCPPLNEKSGLYGGDLGPGIAWRLEQLGWDRSDPTDYIIATASGGRTVSTRPDQYPGNRTDSAGNVMAMPAWAQRYGGPLRDDQIVDLAAYLTNFRSAIPDDPKAAAKVTGPAQPMPGQAGAKAAQAGMQAASSLSPEDRGAELFKSATCVACHALPGVSEAKVCPNLAGIAERAATRVTDPTYTGQAKTAEDYIRESVRNPNAFHVPGETYAPNGKSLMPTFGTDRLTDQDIDALIAYLKKQGG
jgi:cytochrome c2